MGSINLSDDLPIDIEGLSDRPECRKGEKQWQKRKARVNSVTPNTIVLGSVEKFTKEFTKNVEEIVNQECVLSNNRGAHN